LKKCKSLMVQGTTSHSGKTLLVAAFCRLLSKSGYKVAPFKAQNMSLNSMVTSDGAEISRAQTLQASAAGVDATADMNPILLKPKDPKTCQVIVHGKPRFDLKYADYMTDFAPKEGLRAVKESYKRLTSAFDVIIIEGAGSPAEINLRHDIANMRVAELAGASVILTADIDRGGAFASLVGTISLLKMEDRSRVKGLIINKLRGDPELLKPGIEVVQRVTGKKVLGVIPYVHNLSLPQEDSLSLEGYKSTRRAGLDIAVIRLPHISNFTDFDSLCSIKNVSLRYVSSKEELGIPDALIIPGTKNTLSDLKWMRVQGLDLEVSRIAKMGVPLIGICGGFQMLGKTIIDKKGVEDGVPGVHRGLGLLDVSTEFQEYAKLTRRVRASVFSEGPILGHAHMGSLDGYEIHMGKSALGSAARPAFKIDCDDQVEVFDGAIDASGLILGTYIHGIFDSSPLRRALFRHIALKKGLEPPEQSAKTVREGWLSSIDLVADVVRKNLDVAEIYRITGLNQDAYSHE